MGFFLFSFFLRRTCKPSKHNLFMNSVKRDVMTSAEYPYFLLVPLRNYVGKKMVEWRLYFVTRNNCILPNVWIYGHAIIKYTIEILLDKFVFGPFSHFSTQCLWVMETKSKSYFLFLELLPGYLGILNGQSGFLQVLLENLCWTSCLF